MSVLIKGGLIVTDPLRGATTTGDLLVSGDRIVAVGTVQPTPGTDAIDAGGCWVLPGLIDAHTHLYAALATGMPLMGEAPRNFPEVLARVWWRLDKALTPGDIHSSAYIGCLQSLRSGTTTIFDHHASPGCPAGSLDVLAEVIDRVGLRASLAYEVSDRDGPASREAGITENSYFIEQRRKAGSCRLCAHFGLHAVFSVSDKTLFRCAEIGNQLGVGFHLHLLEHRPELDRFREGHNGIRVTEHLETAGILGLNTIAAHAVHVDDEDMRRLARTRTSTAHNPKSNMGNGVGVSPVTRLLQHGVRACLGSDGFYDLPQQMVTASLLQCLVHGDPSAFGMQQVLQMVYGNNAALAERTFGLRFGRLEPGCAGDVLVIAYDPPTPFHPNNLAGHIANALCAGPRDVIVGGRVCLRAGQLVSIDEAAVRAESRQRAGELWKRL